MVVFGSLGLEREKISRRPKMNRETEEKKHMCDWMDSAAHTWRCKAAVFPSIQIISTLLTIRPGTYDQHNTAFNQAYLLDNKVSFATEQWGCVILSQATSCSSSSWAPSYGRKADGKEGISWWGSRLGLRKARVEIVQLYFSEHE